MSTGDHFLWSAGGGCVGGAGRAKLSRTEQGCRRFGRGWNNTTAFALGDISWLERSAHIIIITSHYCHFVRPSSVRPSIRLSTRLAVRSSPEKHDGRPALRRRRRSICNIGLDNLDSPLCVRRVRRWASRVETVEFKQQGSSYFSPRRRFGRRRRQRRASASSAKLAQPTTGIAGAEFFVGPLVNWPADRAAGTAATPCSRAPRRI